MTMQASYTGVLAPVLAALLSIQHLTNVLGKTEEYSLSSWDPATHACTQTESKLLAALAQAWQLQAFEG